MQQLIAQFKALPAFDKTAVFYSLSDASSGVFPLQNVPNKKATVSYMAEDARQQALFAIVINLAANITCLALNRIIDMNDQFGTMNQLAGILSNSESGESLKGLSKISKDMDVVVDLVTQLHSINPYPYFEHQVGDTYTIESYVSETERASYGITLEDFLSKNPNLNTDSPLEDLKTLLPLMEPTELDVTLRQDRTGQLVKIPSGLLAIRSIFIDGVPSGFYFDKQEDSTSIQ